VTRGRRRMQRMVTPSPTWGMYSETDEQGDYSRIALRGVSRKLIIRGGVSISHVPCLPCHIDLIDNIACSNHCMLTLYCLIAHSVVINRRLTMRVTVAGNWQAVLLTYRFWNRNLGRIVPRGGLNYSSYSFSGSEMRQPPLLKLCYFERWWWRWRCQCPLQ